MHLTSRIIVGVLLLSDGLGNSAAAMDAKAVQVAAKVVGFVRPAAIPGAKINVVPGAAALADVQAAMPAFAVSAGDGVGAYAVFVTNTAEAKAAGPKVLTIGTLACVDAGACVVAIESSPKVAIYLSTAAAAAAGIDFDASFKLMVTAK